ncbi:XRE family transcriptional regulator [Acinetobacter radioresistens]
MLTLYDYWKGLSREQRIAFCEKTKITYSYMEVHLIHGRKKPGMDTLQAIVDASDKKLTHEGLFNFFLNKAPAA